MTPDELNTSLTLTFPGHSEELSVFRLQPIDVEQGKRVLERFLCHYIVALLPEEGANEMFDNLANMWEFYAAPVRSLPARSNPKLEAGSVIETRERPPLVLED